MMEAKQRIIFDEEPYFDSEGLEIAMDALLADNLFTTRDPTRDELFDRAMDLMDDDLEHELAMLSEYLDRSSDNPNRGNHLIARGAMGRWDGMRGGLTVYDSLDAMLYGNESIFDDCKINKIWDENGSLFIHGSHHDGCVEVEVRQLTNDGEAIYGELGEAEDIWDPITLPDDRGACDSQTFNPGEEGRLFSEMWDNPRYAAMPRYMERYFGCPQEDWDEPFEFNMVVNDEPDDHRTLLMFAGSPSTQERYVKIGESTLPDGRRSYSYTMGAIDFMDDSSDRYTPRTELDKLAAAWSGGAMSVEDAMKSGAFRAHVVASISEMQINNRFEAPRYTMDLLKPMAAIAGHLGIPAQHLSAIMQETAFLQRETTLSDFEQDIRTWSPTSEEPLECRDMATADIESEQR